MYPTLKYLFRCWIQDKAKKVRKFIDTNGDNLLGVACADLEGAAASGGNAGAAAVVSGIHAVVGTQWR